MMKKIILLLSLVAMSTGAFAQEWSYGLKAGLNLSEVSGVSDSKMKPSIYAGAFAEYRFSYLFGIQPEIVYSRQGVKGSSDEWLRMNYLNVPILAKIYVLDNLSVDLGPQFGLLLNAKEKYKDGSTKLTRDFDPAKSFDFSVGMGLTYTIMYHLDVTARYNLGLTDAIDGDGTNRNGVIQVGLGYRF